jgi:hypothetical protein
VCIIIIIIFSFIIMYENYLLFKIITFDIPFIIIIIITTTSIQLRNLFKDNLGLFCFLIVESDDF